MYEVLIEEEFSAAHHIQGYQGECQRLHGHNWRVQVIANSHALNKLGMVIDFREMEEATNKVIKPLDHQYLNELPEFSDKNPTSEIIAEHIYAQLKLLFPNIPVAKVLVWETPTKYGAYQMG
ncbi:6-carboxytetrahydropterin synthase QueD [Candidatus Desantisbacteria bacterium CG_4_8_14_3_um_filter_40_12]|uniref:6-carboxy-5,6,7,8-tetrahydropterin synthase n=2 Tax=unclassified Candidatus Desantisiibacteriota TaxID=3106372 RepID=A0A2M7J9E2_9BACT|nr:MAG: 6-carboxytetrahydropterin synthase QueD [Candidatus Desantisbacteria bacterium CG23_combo_of_CG06-09_8_20_14_all_40_23]PIX16029.1 MAG: 6-carboxytetrahydropterin synthase QueD [Candidatus Desantisbacteria bacterium CG_4_8_14_3_um_filter_40_12]